MRYLEAKITKPIGGPDSFGVLAQQLHIFVSRKEDVRDEGYDDGKRKDGKHSTPDETEIVLVFAAYFGVNIFVIPNVGAEPFRRTLPCRRLFLALGGLLFAFRFILFYAFLCVHLIISSLFRGCKGTKKSEK